jgi:hypothetical protein
MAISFEGGHVASSGVVSFGNDSMRIDNVPLEPATVAADALLAAAIKQFEERDAGRADLPLAIVAFNERGTWKANSIIFKKFLERRRRLAGRNRALPHLIRTHVTTEPESS